MLTTVSTAPSQYRPPSAPDAGRTMKSIVATEPTQLQATRPRLRAAPTSPSGPKETKVRACASTDSDSTRNVSESGSMPPGRLCLGTARSPGNSRSPWPGTHCVQVAPASYIDAVQASLSHAGGRVAPARLQAKSSAMPLTRSGMKTTMAAW